MLEIPFWFCHFAGHGWLVNIENKVEPSLVASLLDLLHKLTVAVKEEVPEGMVLWYDSVTREVRILSCLHPLA